MSGHRSLLREKTVRPRHCRNRVALEQHIRKHENRFSAKILRVNRNLDRQHDPLADKSLQSLKTLTRRVESGALEVGKSLAYEALHWLSDAVENHGKRVVLWFATDEEEEEEILL